MRHSPDSTKEGLRTTGDGALAPVELSSRGEGLAAHIPGLPAQKLQASSALILLLLTFLPRVSFFPRHWLHLFTAMFPLAGCHMSHHASLPVSALSHVPCQDCKVHTAEILCPQTPSCPESGNSWQDESALHGRCWLWGPFPL